MDPLLYFSITSRARFFPGAIRTPPLPPPRAPTLRPSPVPPVNSPRGLRLLLEIEKILGVICRRSATVFVERER